MPTARKKMAAPAPERDRTTYVTWTPSRHAVCGYLSRKVVELVLMQSNRPDGFGGLPRDLCLLVLSHLVVPLKH